MSLTPDADEMHAHIFETLKLEGSYIGDLLYFTLNMSVYIHKYIQYSGIVPVCVSTYDDSVAN